MEEIISTLTEAIVLQKERIDEINITLDLLQDETKLNQDELSKLRDTLTKRIEDIYIQTDKLINKAISGLNLEAPKVDYDKIKDFIKNDFELLEKYIKDIMPKDGKDGLNGSDGKDGVDGADGKDADNELIIKELQDFIKDNSLMFKGANGIDGKDGKNGKDGADGVGIEDIKRVKDDLIITLTNGVTRSFKIPKDMIRVMGGGSSVDLSNYYNKTDINTIAPEDTYLYNIGSTYKEFEKNIDGEITKITTWDGVDKVTKLVTKTIENEPNKTIITLTDETTGTKTIKTINYSNGEIVSVENAII